MPKYATVFLETMPTAGRYSYPVKPLDDLIDRLRKAYEVAGVNSTREVIAGVWKLEPKGGGFATLIAALQNYGLVETGYGEVRITELGKTIAFEVDKAALDRAKAQAVRNVELFRDYYDQYSSDVTEEKVRTFLRAKGNVDVVMLPRITTEISKLLNKVLPYLATVKVGGELGGALVASVQPVTPASPSASTGGVIGTMTPVEDGIIEFRVGALYQRYPISDIVLAKQVIDTLLESKIKKSQTTEPPPSETTEGSDAS